MIKLGIENIESYRHLFEGKRVGLITNPTGVDQTFKSTIEIIHEMAHLVSLFSPEHGVRGNVQAGVKLDPYVDPETKAMVYSLYGETRKPTEAMMNEIDILCFDIQDVGARFYTFIYTMAFALEACKQYGKKMVVFDRPNPLGGLSVEGNLLDLKFRSFVGYYSIPQRYGLTIGELAHYFNEEEGIHADLTVIPMQGYVRSMHFKDTQLPFVLPSPNIPTADSIYAYLATCYFEGTNMSEGRGTTKPFQIFGAPWFNSKAVLTALKAYDLKGVTFRKHFFTPTFSKHQQVLCEGLELYVTDTHQFEPVKTGMILLHIIKQIHPQFELIIPPKAGQNLFFNLLIGDDFIEKKTLSLDQIFEKMKRDQSHFITVKERYHLYDL